MSKEVKSAREALEKSRLEVSGCEAEIKSIKDALKSLAMGASGDPAANRLEVSVLGVKAAAAPGECAGGDGGGGDTPETFKIHLSSPIEHRTVTRLRDPLDPGAEGSVARFESVETSNALLTVEAYSNDRSLALGSSAPHDLLPLCLDAELWKKGGKKKTSTLDISIVADHGIHGIDTRAGKAAESKESVEFADAHDISETSIRQVDGSDKELTATENDEKKDEVKETTTRDGTEASETAIKEGGGTEKQEAVTENGEKKDEMKAIITKDGMEHESKLSTADAAAQDETNTTKLLLPTYTLKLQLEYTPSIDDRRDALYDELNEASKRKASAIEALRKHASVVNRAKAAEATTGKDGSIAKRPAVKPGFLNREKIQPQPFWRRWYNKTIGPKSMLWTVMPIAKNYIIFVGASLLIHWKGDLLALPPPV